MYGLLQDQFDEVVFCTAPIDDPACTAGKHGFLLDRFGSAFRDYVLTNRKDLLASPNHILIDDALHNVSAFVAKGGQACIFPQPWNTQSAATIRAAWLDDLRAGELHRWIHPGTLLAE
jgi:5'(3')-deoxyribonucleotidase